MQVIISTSNTLRHSPVCTSLGNGCNQSCLFFVYFSNFVLFNQMKTCLLLIVLNSLFFISNAQWVQTKGPKGGCINSFVSSGGNLFVAADDGGVYISPDSGLTWTAVNNGLIDVVITTLEIIGSDLFAGTQSSGVYVTSNNGSSWVPVSNGLPANASVLSFARIGNYLYVAPLSADK